MSLTQKGRKVRSGNGEVFPPGGDAPTFTSEMSSLLKRAYGGRHSAVKIVAAALGANERAVKNWFDGKNGPNGENLLRLVIHSDAMLVGFLAMAGKQGIVVSLELDQVVSAIELALIEIRKLHAD
ncbi:hypothetical protein [Acidisphaera sp. L21]|uniref:hypothetical protein n=1 Tax=Acidisphaera sp. L21 TaxID=1641851 RepID=UPI00131EBE7F|nr:hypothetical protein [Acidisphaera sp. L21]